MNVWGRGMGAKKNWGPAQYTALAAVIAIHLALLVIFVVASKSRQSSREQIPEITALIFVPAPTSRRGPVAALPNQLRIAIAPQQNLPLPLAEPTPEAPQQPRNEPPHNQEFVDWAASAQRAAKELLASEATEHERNAKMGTGWWLAQDAKQRRRTPGPAFPWSHQPQTSWVDFDPNSLVITFTLGRRCQLSVFLLVPGFGCVVGYLDPEPGRGDLFDSRYRSSPIELPVAMPVDGADK